MSYLATTLPHMVCDELVRNFLNKKQKISFHLRKIMKILKFNEKKKTQIYSNIV